MSNSITIPLIVICIFSIILLTFHMGMISGKAKKNEIDIAVIKTILVMRDIMPSELYKEKGEK